jgi:hypothetical protein
MVISLSKNLKGVYKMGLTFVEKALAHSEALKLKNKEQDLVKLQRTQEEFGKLFDPKFAGSRLPWQELMSASDFGVLIQKVVTDKLQLPVEPEYLGVKMFTQTLTIDPHTVYKFPILNNAVTAVQVPNNQRIPRQDLAITSHAITADMLRTGIAFDLDPELLNDSMYNLLPYYVEAGRRAMLRAKEEQVWKKCLERAYVMFDNGLANPAAWTTGKGDDARTPNGAFSLNDMIDMMGGMYQKGYTPTDLITSHITWAIWFKDPLIRNQMHNGGQIGQGIWSKLPDISSAGIQSVFPFGVTYHATRFMEPRFGVTLSGGLPAATGTANVSDVLLIDRNDPLLILQK